MGSLFSKQRVSVDPESLKAKAIKLSSRALTSSLTSSCEPVATPEVDSIILRDSNSGDYSLKESFIMEYQSYIPTHLLLKPVVPAEAIAGLVETLRSYDSEVNARVSTLTDISRFDTATDSSGGGSTKKHHIESAAHTFIKLFFKEIPAIKRSLFRSSGRALATKLLQLAITSVDKTRNENISDIQNIVSAMLELDDESSNKHTSTCIYAALGKALLATIDSTLIVLLSSTEKMGIVSLLMYIILPPLVSADWVSSAGKARLDSSSSSRTSSISNIAASSKSTRRLGSVSKGFSMTLQPSPQLDYVPLFQTSLEVSCTSSVTLVVTLPQEVEVMAGDTVVLGEIIEKKTKSTSSSDKKEVKTKCYAVTNTFETSNSVLKTNLIEFLATKEEVAYVKSMESFTVSPPFFWFESCNLELKEDCFKPYASLLYIGLGPVGSAIATTLAASNDSDNKILIVDDEISNYLNTNGTMMTKIILPESKDLQLQIDWIQLQVPDLETRQVIISSVCSNQKRVKQMKDAFNSECSHNVMCHMVNDKPRSFSVFEKSTRYLSSSNKFSSKRLATGVTGSGSLSSKTGSRMLESFKSAIKSPSVVVPLPPNNS